MARAVIAVATMPHAGVDLVLGGSYTTMGAGADNGVEFEYAPGALLYLRNTTGATVTFTVLVPTPDAYAQVGIVIPDVAISVIHNRSFAYQSSGIFVHPDGKMRVDCSAAGLIAVMRV